MTLKLPTHRSRDRVAALLALSLAAAASGCEIIASFNRDLIPTDLDAGVTYDGAYPDGGGEPDVTVAEAGGDAGVAETGPAVDGGLDSSSVDATGDVTVAEAGGDAGGDAGVAETGPAVDGGLDSSSMDATGDTSAPVDAGGDDDAG